jgi:D-xylose transport system ATP-binding protein
MSIQNKPIIEMRGVSKRFGGVQALQDVNIDLYEGEVLGIVGHNGAGKSTLIKILSGAYHADTGIIYFKGKEVEIKNPKDSKALGIETIYQHLALADNLNVPSSIFLGREIKNRFGILDDRSMEIETRQMLERLKIKIESLKVRVQKLSGGQRQSIAISRAIYFNAKVLIMDEPTAALGVEETNRVHELMKQLKNEGVAIILISHDLHDIFKLSDRVAVLKNGVLIGTRKTSETTKDEVLTMIILGQPEIQSKMDDQIYQ